MGKDFDYTWYSLISSNSKLNSKHYSIRKDHYSLTSKLVNIYPHPLKNLVVDTKTIAVLLYKTSP